MDKIIKNTLEKIEKNGYEAYIIGGYVRDLLVGKSSFDIDICTNATPKVLISIFPDASSKNLGGIDFKNKEYHFEITTYREEIKYNNRRPTEFNYVNSLLIDLQRRDFTINALCMNKNGNIIDLVDGLKDMQEKRLKMIGNAKIKLKEDPLRILRAIRIATTLDFHLEESLYKGIKKSYKEVLTLSSTRIKEELDKILLSSNVKKGLSLLNDFHILKVLKIKTNESIIPIKSLEGMYAQLEYEYDFPFTKEEKNNISALREILELKQISSKIVYHYGLYLSQIAGEILNIDKETIAKIHQELQIHDKKEIDIKASDIVEVLNLTYSDKISKILNDIEEQLIENKLKNNKEEITNYLLENKEKWMCS